MKVLPNDRSLFIALYRAESGLDFSTFYLRYRMPPSQLAESARRLEKQKFVAREGVRLHLTESGRKYVQENSHLFIHTDAKLWRNVPEKFKAAQIAAFEPYAPRLSKLHLSKRKPVLDQQFNK